MKREIKFRGKTTDGRWLFGYLFFVLDVPHIAESIQMDGSKYEIRWTRVIPESIGQFIGLTDKNGREIYDLDVLGCEKYSSPRFRIEYKDSECRFVGYHIPADNYGSCGIDQSWVNEFEMEILGNLYENPELLK